MERESSVVEFHATTVAPMVGSKTDMAGGTNVPFDEKHEALYQVGSAPRSDLDEDEPTEEEVRTLRRVTDKLPARIFLVAAVELCERFAYYGLSGPFQNYIQNPYPHSADPDPANWIPGALGMGQQAATGLVNFFSFWCYVTPILGAIIADQYLGRYKTILYSAMVYIVGLIILFTTALPTALTHNAGTGGLIASMIVIGIATGGIKSNVSPLIAEQYSNTKRKLKTLKSGERVIVDPSVTIQSIYMFFYLAINIGSLSPIATTEMERNINWGTSNGFWTAFLLCTCVFILGFVLILIGKKYYVTRAPTGSVIPSAFKAMWIGLVNGGKLDVAKPSYQEEYGRKYATPWNDIFIEELKRALIACKVFVFYPIYWVVYSQMLNNFISQAGEMALHGIPNDLMQNIDPLTIIIFIPIIDRFVYPTMRKFGIAFKPITRIFWGFMFGTAAMAYAAGVQHLINTSPPNSVHVAIQTPAYFFIAISEIFASITGLEYAYTKAPSSMKSFIMSMFLLTSAIGSAIAIALSPTTETDEKLQWMYTGLAVSCFIAGLIFWALYSRYNKYEDDMNAIESEGQQVKAVGAVNRKTSLAGVIGPADA